MKTKHLSEEFIAETQDLLDEVDTLLDTNINVLSSKRWHARACKHLKKQFGKNHPYLQTFKAIDFTTTFSDGVNKSLAEDTHRLGLEDSRSFLISLIDVIDAEDNNAPCLMDMESIFAEINRYVSVNVVDPFTKTTINHRISRLRDGMIAGDISGEEVNHHMKHIGYVDPALLDRITPIVTWYYIHRGV
ncbi:MAG: hypothetical protein U9P80_10290 [Thermodesulfobacteriota bacterium]|nr:hypothetical protein [Thermodesulfobacteriota bacterium]